VSSRSGRATRLFVSTRRGPSRAVDTLDLEWTGVRGDRHHGALRLSDARTPWHRRGTKIVNTRQVSLVSTEECAILADKLGIPNLDPALLGANILTDGLPDLSFLPAGTRLQFPSGATVYVTDQNEPCRKAGRLVGEAHARSDLELLFSAVGVGLRGIMGLVESEGRLLAGERFRVVRRLPSGSKRADDNSRA
jgi:MOSC domain-containing protein YiiM